MSLPYLRPHVLPHLLRACQHELDHLDGILFTDIAARGSLIHESEAASASTRARVMRQILAQEDDYEYEDEGPGLEK